MFSIYDDVYFEYKKCYKKNSGKYHREYMFENCCKQIGFTKENNYY